MDSVSVPGLVWIRDRFQEHTGFTIRTITDMGRVLVIGQLLGVIRYCFELGFRAVYFDAHLRVKEAFDTLLLSPVTGPQ